MAINSILNELQMEICPDLSSQFPAQSVKFRSSVKNQNFSLGSYITHVPSPHCSTIQTQRYIFRKARTSFWLNVTVIHTQDV
jgi:hypothetical protein